MGKVIRLNDHTIELIEKFGSNMEKIHNKSGIEGKLIYPLNQILDMAITMAIIDTEKILKED